MSRDVTLTRLASRLGDGLRPAVRQLVRARTHAATMIGALAIGIASAAAIFSVVRDVLLRPLPYANAESIVSVQEYQPAERRDQTTVASANLSRIAGAQSFAAVSAFTYSEYVVSDERDAQRVLGARVDGDLLTVLGVQPALGRGIASEEAGDNAARVVVISDALWRRRFAAAVSALGASLIVDGAPYTIVGIMSPRFEFPRNPAMARDVDVWVPRRPLPPMMVQRGMRDLTVVARLKRGAPRADAQRELSVIADRAAAARPSLNAGWAIRVMPLRDVVVGGVRPALVMLSVCVGALLLIASTNVAAGTLARITTRRQTLGIRLALGATPARLTELLLGESLVLAGAALAGALPLGVFLRRLLVTAAPVAVPRHSDAILDVWTVVFAASVAALMAAVTVIAPSLWIRRLDLRAFLAEAGRTASGSRGQSNALRLFLVVQLTFATILLAATARLYSNYARLNSVDPGFIANHVTTATVALGGMRYQAPAARSALMGQLLAKVRAIPGVEHAAVTSLLPMSGGLMSSTFMAPGFVSDSSRSAALRAVSPDFFVSLGIPIRGGRPIAALDDDGAIPVVVVNQVLEKEVFRGRSALGQSLVVSPPGSDAAQPFQIVGVAGDAKEKDLLAPATPVIYFSDRQASFPHSVLVVRSRGQFPAQAVRAVLRELDPTLALDDVGSLEDKVRSSYALQFFLLLVLGTFAVSAAALVGIGVYGSVSFMIAAELRAIGIRMALGASPQRILGSTLGRTVRPALVGCLLGTLAVAGAPRLFRVDALIGSNVGWVPGLVGAVCVLLVAIGATIPLAWRASVLDPVVILRD